MAKCIVIGGGISGLTAAAYLVKGNHKVKLIEASPKLGGRAYSFQWDDLTIDNGQHLLMGCYKNTLELLKLTGGIESVNIQPNIKATFVQHGGRISNLKAPSSLYPFNLALALTRFNAFNFRERLKILALFSRLASTDPVKYANISVKEWLLNLNQPKKAVNTFWHLLCVSILNTSIDEASAAVFINVLKIIFLGGKNNSGLVIPALGLSEVFGDKIKQFIIQNGGTISLSEKAVKINLSEAGVESVDTGRGKEADFDYVISTIPLTAISKLLPHPVEESLIKGKFDYSPIMNVHFRLNENPFTEEFYGFLGSKIHWVFNKGSHINLVISGADEFTGMDNEMIFQILGKELEDFFPCFYRKQVDKYIVIKEKKATFKSTPRIEEIRRGMNLNYKNLIIAGDWVNTGLPSTIESAVSSGMRAASEIQNKS